MKSRLSLKIVFLMVLAFAGRSAFAGDKVGNGGGAYICPDRAQSEFLDLYEARRPADSRPALKIPVSTAPVEEQIQAVFNKLKQNELLYKNILKEYEIVRSAPSTPPPRDQQLAWPDDEKNQYIKAGCQALGVIIFHDYPLAMDLDGESLKSMPNTEQAAAWVHETLYRYFRLTQYDKDSIRTRAVVGYLFSDEIGDQLKTDLIAYRFNIADRAPGLSINNINHVGYYLSEDIADNPVPIYNTPLTYPIFYKITQQIIDPKLCKPVEEIDGSATLATSDSPTYMDWFSTDEIADQYDPVAKYGSPEGCLWNFMITDSYGNAIHTVYDVHWFDTENLKIVITFPGNPY